MPKYLLVKYIAIKLHNIRQQYIDVIFHVFIGLKIDYGYIGDWLTVVGTQCLLFYTKSYT